MKIVFLVICCVCAGLLSTLVFTIQTGKIPFREDVAEPVASAPASTQVVDSLIAPISEADQKRLNELVKAFDTEKAALDAQRAKLATHEEQIKLQQAVQETLKVEVESLQKELESRIFAIKAEQQANYRRLADMYAKMDPALASNLLREGDRKHAAAILGMMADRATAAVMDATVQTGGTNIAAAAEWVETMRTLTVDKKAETKE